MMKQQREKHHIEALAVLLLFGVFAACILSVLLTGAGAYRGLTARDDAAYHARTAAQYLATKVRQADAAGQVWVAPFFPGGPADDTLYLQEGDYCTRVYCYDGSIWELFSSPEGSFVMADGEPILPAQALSLSLTDGLLTLTVTLPDGGEETVTLALRGGEEAPA